MFNLYFKERYNVKYFSHKCFQPSALYYKDNIKKEKKKRYPSGLGSCSETQESPEALKTIMLAVPLQ